MSTGSTLVVVTGAASSHSTKRCVVWHGHNAGHVGKRGCVSQPAFVAHAAASVQLDFEEGIGLGGFATLYSLAPNDEAVRGGALS